MGCCEGMRIISLGDWRMTGRTKLAGLGKEAFEAGMKPQQQSEAVVAGLRCADQDNVWLSCRRGSGWHHRDKWGLHAGAQDDHISVAQGFYPSHRSLGRGSQGPMVPNLQALLAGSGEKSEKAFSLPHPQPLRPLRETVSMAMHAIKSSRVPGQGGRPVQLRCS